MKTLSPLAVAWSVGGGVVVTLICATLGLHVIEQLGFDALFGFGLGILDFHRHHS